MSTSSIMNPMLCKVYKGLTSSLEILWVKHMVKDSSWGISRSLEGSRNGFLILRGNHNSTGLHLVQEAVAKVFSASWSLRWNPWCILSCLSPVDERDERGKVA